MKRPRTSQQGSLCPSANRGDVFPLELRGDLKASASVSAPQNQLQEAPNRRATHDRTRSTVRPGQRRPCPPLRCVGFLDGCAILLRKAWPVAVAFEPTVRSIWRNRKGHLSRDGGHCNPRSPSVGCDLLLHRHDVHVAYRPILGQSTLNVAERAGRRSADIDLDLRSHPGGRA